MSVYYAYYDSPIGAVEITAADDHIKSLYFRDELGETDLNTPPVMQECINQLDEYFKKERTDFDLPLSAEGTEFQHRVWKALLNVPFGRTASYLDIANILGDRNSVRAVGNANGKNPISVIVPCHRIIGSGGKLIGYGGGLWRKEWLLKHEGSLLI